MALNLDAHQKPPEALKALYKTYQKAQIEELSSFKAGLIDSCSISSSLLFRHVPWVTITAAERMFCDYADKEHESTVESSSSVDAFESTDFPGLILLPSVLPCDTQRLILERTLHCDLANVKHMTNVHFHHDITYPPQGHSFFDLDGSSSAFLQPKDPKTHKPITVKQFLNKKLRWITLGGQYDWTTKKYPKEEPPSFPKSLSQMLRGLFPQTKAEAAIVNLYSPGDVLSLHRDVSEFCDRGLISMSIGCDGIFLVGDSQGSKQLAIRLRSGDALYMTGHSRYLWHGVPRVMAGTCPPELQSWPAPTLSSTNNVKEDFYSCWRDWLASKRINLNIRQMHA